MTPVGEVDALDVYGTADPIEMDAGEMVADPLAGMPNLPELVLPSSPGSFFRLVPAPPADIDAWWSAAASHGAVELDHRLRLGAPHDEGGGARSIRGALRRPATHRWVPVDIVLCPHLGSVSKLTLNPAGRVRPTRRWFRSGHRALERLARDVGAFAVSRPARRALPRS